MARLPLVSMAALGTLFCGAAANFGCIGSISELPVGGPAASTPGAGPSSPGAPGTPGVNSPATPGMPGSVPTPGSMGDPTRPPDPSSPADPNAVGPQPLRRLDRREYNNTVRDLLGDTSKPADRFPSDRDSDFTYRHAGLVSAQDFATIQDAAESLGALAEKNLATLAPCAGGSEETCARDFATSFGLRAYRRPLDGREIDSLVQLYKDVRSAPSSLTHAGGIRVMVQGLLQSPAFLYHWEGGPSAPTLEGQLVRLSDYENAAQLSYFLWGSMPDTTLFEAAANHKLGTQQELQDQARRMLADPKARDTVSEFVEEWLGLDQVAERPKDPKLYPEFKDDLKAAMIAEARAFVSQVVFDGDSRLSTLLTATYGFVNQPLAALYGLQGAQSPDLAQADLDPNQRAGLLTQAAFLTVTGSTDGSHPVKRGRKVYERILCGELPPPPNDVPPPKTADQGGTTRQRFSEHSAMACAKGCHSLMDPIGFTFEHYDGIGKYRTMDNGGVVDSTSALELDGTKKDLKDARDLVQFLSTSKLVRGCFATQWARYAFKRMETEGDRASLQAITAAFGKDGNNIRDLMIGVAASRSFRYRMPAQGEMLQ